MSAQPVGPTGPEILEGGTRLPITMRDGAKRTAVVRVLPVRQIQRFTQIGDDIAGVAELFTGNKPGWADTVSDASLYEIVTEGERLNRDPLSSFVAFQKGRGERLAEIIAVKPTILPDSLPASVSEPA